MCVCVSCVCSDRARTHARTHALTQGVDEGGEHHGGGGGGGVPFCACEGRAQVGQHGAFEEEEEVWEGLEDGEGRDRGGGGGCFTPFLLLLIEV